MGNSSGNLEEWWEAFQRLNHAQGGFLWDWIDQGLHRLDGRGRAYFAYGGDFGEAMHDAQFCANGLLFPDRTPHPAAWQVKHVQRPVEVAPLSWSNPKPNPNPNPDPDPNPNPSPNPNPNLPAGRSSATRSRRRPARPSSRGSPARRQHSASAARAAAPACPT